VSSAAADCDAIVVGGGIAGLMAGYLLTGAGLRVILLEASGRLGGRLRTERFDGSLVDVGAQFVMATYSTLLPIVGKLGLDRQLRPVSPWAATVRRKKLYRFRVDRPLSTLRSRLVGPATLARLAWHISLPDRMGRLPLNDCLAWAQLDDEDARSWCLRTLGRGALDWLVEPLLAGMCFQTPERASRVLPMMILQALDRGRRFGLRTLAGGFQTLCQALAARLEVRLESCVERLSRNGGQVEAWSARGMVRAPAAIVAIPAPSASGILGPATGPERRLLQVGYRSSLTVTLSVEGEWGAAAPLEGVYGLLIPRRERRWIASVGSESAKGTERLEGRDYLNVFVDSAAAAELLPLDDSAVLDRVLSELDGYLPGLSRKVRSGSVVRWEQADPDWSVGRLRDVAAYRRSWSGDRAVVLAGDYAGIPFNDGAAESASWASQRLLETLQPRTTPA
jgi:protoporphyrinogen/coproporphyrinogen III oxidase